MDPAVALARLRWRCRRGMRELDLMLSGWLEARWPSAPASLRAAFVRLLELEDARLWALLAGAESADPELRSLCEDIRRHARPDP
ncbi:MAG: succinate dehydrogenase assembly factor 2 [Xanthomonadales bacterium]|nr:succinate dehydrogenase assembly factor 2 [Xanthomonadales bacterium]